MKLASIAASISRRMDSGQLSILNHKNMPAVQVRISQKGNSQMPKFMAHLTVPTAIHSDIERIDVYYRADDQDDAENLATSLVAHAFPEIQVDSVHEMSV